MVHIVEEVKSVGRDEDLEAEKRTVFKIKGPDKICAELLSVSFIGGFHIHPKRHIPDGTNAGDAVDYFGAYFQERIQTSSFLNGIGELLRVDPHFFRKEHGGGIVIF